MIQIGISKHVNNKNYIHLGKHYIYDKALYIMMLLVFVLPLLFLGNPIDLLFDQHQQDIKVYYYNERRLKTVTGNIKIKDHNEIVRYSGEVVGGRCQGQGTLFDTKGKRVYLGNFSNNAFDGENGTLYYETGKVKYQGGFKENAYQGPGLLYYESGILHQEGNFVQGKLNGIATEYKEDGNILYTGNFTNNRYDQEGTIYTLESDRIEYIGNFIAGKKEGMGSLLDSTGFTYYQGNMHNDGIDYSSFLQSSLEDVDRCFMHHYDIFIYQDITAIVFRKEQVIFFSHNPISVTYKEKRQINNSQGQPIFLLEVELDERMNKKDIIIDRILILDSTLLSLTKETSNDKQVAKILGKYLEKEEDKKETTYPMYKDLVMQINNQEKLTIPKLGSFLYVFLQEKTSIINSKIYVIEGVKYTYGANQQGIIEYVVLENHVSKKE